MYTLRAHISKSLNQYTSYKSTHLGEISNKDLSNIVRLHLTKNKTEGLGPF